MKSDENLVQKSSAQLPVSSDTLKDALQYVADKTNEAKKAAENNPLTSTGKPKSELKGAAKITNQLKEEGIEAYKRDIVPQPNMEGGIKNNEMNVAANAALAAITMSEQQSINCSDKNEK